MIQQTHKPVARAKAQGRAVPVKTVAPQYFTVIDAEIYSGMSRWSWRRWAYSGRVSSVKIAQKLLIPKSEIDRLMAAGLRPALPDAELVGAGQ